MTLHFSGLLLQPADCERTMTLSAATLGDALAAVEQRYPQLHAVLHDRDGHLRRTHRIFINGELEYTAELSTPLADKDHVDFVTAITGG